jgi:aminocarboxymuconate-semialdehyde decarboxylase
MASTTRIVDIHTHMYPPPYIELVRQRTEVPFIRTSPTDPNDVRLVLLPGEATGRPVGSSYWDVSEKLAFMDLHGISTSVISLANPWLDFITDGPTALKFAVEVNDWFETTGKANEGRLYFFAVLPIKASIAEITTEINRVKTLPHCRGVILGTTGAGNGLDDPAFEPIWKAVAEAQLMVFLHPHYGLPSEVYGPRAEEYGHVLPLALGFPMETTIAVTRMILSGVFSRVCGIKLLLAHSGGTLPFLAGRIQSCIEHDGKLIKDGGELPDVWEILRTNIWLDAVIYGDVGLKAAIDSVAKDGLGYKKVLFGKLNKGT